jgi:hypothetical protein
MYFVIHLIITLTHRILYISLSTQCNFMKQTAKCSIFHQLSNEIIIKQCDSLVILLWPTIWFINVQKESQIPHRPR